LRSCIAATKWHAASKIRLAAGRHKREVFEGNRGLHSWDRGYRSEIDASDAVTQARSIERRTLRALAKLCESLESQREQIAFVDAPVRLLGVSP
jgi:hypothetical protein